MVRKRLVTMGVGWLGNWAMVWVFDFLLCPFIIVRFGILLGGLIMTIISFFVCYGYILFYDNSKKDWLGIETLKEIEDFKPRPVPTVGAGKYAISIINFIGLVSAWLMKKSDAVLLVVLSIKFDPFITVIHIRHGAHKYNGLSKRDWKVFLSSLIISNIYWTLAVFMGITTVKALWEFLIGIV